MIKSSEFYGDSDSICLCDSNLFSKKDGYSCYSIVWFDPGFDHMVFEPVASHPGMVTAAVSWPVVISLCRASGVPKASSSVPTGHPIWVRCAGILE